MRRFTKLWATLLLLCIAGVANAAKEYEVDQRFNSLADLLTSGELFSIVNETDGKMFCFGVGNEQDMNYETYSDAYAKSKSYTFKLEAAQGDDVAGYYYLRPYKPDGTLNNVWGWGGYFNSQPATGTVCFCLGLNNQNGQDIKNGAVWALEESDGKFALKNIGTGLYLKEAAPAKYEEVTYFTFCTLKEIASSDPLAEQKEALETAIAKGKMFNAVAYTEASFTALGTAITAGEAALAAADATAESLTSAQTAIETAQAALKLKDGYIELTQAQFFEWDSATEPTTSKATGCAYELFKPSNMVYGNSSVGLLTFADLSAYDKFIVTVSEGTPRILLNRDVNEGQWNANEEESHLIDNTLDGWHNKYFTSENNVFTVDVKQLTADKGFAHIHSIKSRGMVTVTGLYLYKESEAPVAQSVTFDFNAANHATSSNEGDAGDITADEVNTVDGVVMTITPADPEATTPNRYWSTKNGPQLRMYSGKMTIEAPEGKAITKVVIENGKWNVGNTFNGEAAAEGTWEGNSTNVVLAVAANTQMNKVIVTLADKSEGTTTYKEPLKPLFDDGKYYINNVGTKKYMAAGADWGTHAVVNELGLDYTVAFTPEGKYTLDSQVSNGGDKHFLNGEYNDGLAFGWTFAKVADGIYTISDGAKFLTAGEDGKVTLAEDGTAEAAQWTLIPAADRRAAQIASLADATAENPIDATFLFVDANFNRNDLRKSAWTGDDFAVGGTETNTNAEKWGGNSQTFDVKQTVEVPNGIYKITWNGYYRYNNTTENTNDIAAAAHADGSEVINSFVYLNDQDYPLTSIADEAAVAAFEKMPFSQADATAAFEKGLYEQSAEVTVEDGQLTIGIKKTEHPGTDWTVWDNFRITYFGAPVEVAHTWNFTKWSEETVANLKAEAAKGTSEGLWSDQEKADSSAVTKELSLENCYWQVGTSAAEGETLTANGQEIAELKGLLFTNNKARSLALAVNYGDCTSANGAGFGPYNGPTYLWLGSKGVEYFTIKNVKAGTTIGMGVESHKITDARGVQLFVAGEELKDAEGNAVTAPTTYTEQTWAVPAGEGVVDVVVKNTNGCHIYFIDAEIGEAGPEVNPDEPELVAPEGWTMAIANGNLAGDDVSSYVSKEQSTGETVPSTIVAGAGKNGSRGIVVNSSDNPTQAWDTQFWIVLNEKLQAGAKLHVQFDYKANKAAKATTQAHGAPGAYQHWAAIGDVNFTEDWQTFSTEIEVTADMATGNGGDGLLSIAFNLAEEKTATEYCFDNFGVWYQLPKPVEKWADLIVNGDMEGESMECFYVTEEGVGGPFVAVATEGIGKDGSKAVKVQSGSAAANNWDTQFFVRLPYELPAGTKFKFSFDYKASNAAGSESQSHNEPGQYIHWACAGSPSFTTEWQSYSYEGTIASECNGEVADGGFNKNFQTIAFNLAVLREATEYVFDNVKFEVEESIVSSLTKDPAVDPAQYPVGIKTLTSDKENGAIYDLQGRRVAKPARGLYIINGKKVMVK